MLFIFDRKSMTSLLFIVGGAVVNALAFSGTIKLIEEKLYQVHYQADRLWTGGNEIKELHKITPVSKEDIRSWLPKQALWQVHIAAPKKI